MKKIVIFSLLISISTVMYTAGATPQKPTTPQQFQQQLENRIMNLSLHHANRTVDELEKLEIKRQNLEKQLSSEKKEQIEEERTELLAKVQDEMSEEMKEYGKFILSLDLKKTLAECDLEIKNNKTKNACNIFEEQNKRSDIILNNLGNRASARSTIANKEIEDELKKKYGNDFTIYKKLKKVEDELNSHMNTMAKQTQQR